MGYEINHTADADADIDGIIDYLKQFYPSTPLRFLDELVRVESFLRINPYMYPIFFARPKYRKALVNNYQVFYKVDDVKGIVKIHRVIHGARDIPRHLH